MAMTRKPDSKAEKAADKKRGVKQSKAEDRKESKLPPWLQKKAPARGTKGGKAPRSGKKSGVMGGGY